MDKFGIFKLLSSFLSQNGQNSTSQTENSIGSESKDNPLSSLLNSLTKNSQSSQNNTPTPNQNQPKEKKQFVPLQSAMLSTMNSHDQFVKRVKEKNKMP